MKKAGLLNLLAQLKEKAESEEILHINALIVINLLVEYLNDPQIKGAVDEIPL